MSDHATRATDLLAAASAAIGDRAALRDQPSGERSMARAVRAFNAMYGVQLTELQGWQFMALLKMARGAGGRVHADDYIDQAAYAALAGECAAAGDDMPPGAQRIHPMLHPDALAGLPKDVRDSIEYMAYRPFAAAATSKPYHPT